MTGFDALLIMLIGVSVALAAYRGGLAELVTLIALGLGGVAGVGLAQPIAAAAGRGDSTITILVAGVIVAGLIFIGALIGLTTLLGRVRLAPRLRMADRIGGGAFGLVRAIALIGLGFLGYAYYLDADNRSPAVANALLLPLAEGSAGLIADFAPARTQLGVEDDAAANSGAPGLEASNGPAGKVEDETVDDPAPGHDVDAVARILQEVDS